MTELETIIGCVRDSLSNGGVSAVIVQNPPGNKKRHTNPIVTVGLKAGALSVGSTEYLGEDRFSHLEIYGQRIELTLGLGLWVPKNGEDSHDACLELFSQIAGALGELPEAVRVKELVCGETVFDASAEMFRCDGELRLSAYLIAEKEDDGAFLDFKLKGVITN